MEPDLVNELTVRETMVLYTRGSFWCECEKTIVNCNLCVGFQVGRSFRLLPTTVNLEQFSR